MIKEFSPLPDASPELNELLRKLYSQAGTGDGDISYTDSRHYVSGFARLMTDASGNVGYTGVGFTPTAVSFLGHLTTSSSQGFDDGTTKECSFMYGAAPVYGASALYSIAFYEDAGKYQYANVASFDADGFTLTWTKVGLPAVANGTGYFIAFR